MARTSRSLFHLRPPEGHGDTAEAVQVAHDAAELFDFPAAHQIIPGLLRAERHANDLAVL